MLTAVAFVSADAGAQAQEFFIYDDFSAGIIDPTKWRGANFGEYNESVKLVSGSAFLVGNVPYGFADTDAGVSFEVLGISPISNRLV